MGYYRSTGEEHVRPGVILPDWEQQAPGLSSADPYEIGPEGEVRPREADIAGAMMTVGADPAVVIAMGEAVRGPV